MKDAAMDALIICRRRCILLEAGSVDDDIVEKERKNSTRERS